MCLSPLGADSAPASPGASDVGQRHPAAKPANRSTAPGRSLPRSHPGHRLTIWTFWTTADRAHTAIQPRPPGQWCVRQDPHPVRRHHRGQGPRLSTRRFSFNVKGVVTVRPHRRRRQSPSRSEIMQCREALPGGPVQIAKLECHGRKTVWKCWTCPSRKRRSLEPIAGVHRHLRTLKRRPGLRGFPASLRPRNRR